MFAAELVKPHCSMRSRSCIPAAMAQPGDVRRLRRRDPDHGLWVQALVSTSEAPAWFIGANALWLWFTVLFATFAEALAEGRSKAQAASLRGLKKRGIAKKLQQPQHGSAWTPIETDELRIGRSLLVEAGDMMPCDGEVIEGVASVDESAITGESAPVIREAGGDSRR
jgi:K+-transporting ATPase ATPase B chain